MADPLRIGVIGCGEILRTHLWGYWSIGRAEQESLRVVALCDRSRSQAERYVGRFLRGSPPEEGAFNVAPRRRRYKAGLIGLADLPQGNAPVAVHEVWQELVARDDLDLVVILLPPALHADVAEAALRAGKHVFVEKPLALSVSEARRVCAAAGEGRRHCAVGLNYRFDGAVRAAQWLLSSGRLGAPRLFHSLTLRAPGHRREAATRSQALVQKVRDWAAFHRGKPAGHAPGAEWRYVAEEIGSGELVENGIHLLDLGRALLGEIDRVSGQLGRLQPLQLRGPDGSEQSCAVPDTFQTLLRFRSGVRGMVAVSSGVWGEASSARENFRLYGDEGCVTQESFTGRDGRPEDPWTLLHAGAPAELLERWFPGGLSHRFGLQTLDLLRAIRGSGRAPEVDAREGLHSLAACDAVAKSDLLGREVALSEVLNERPAVASAAASTVASTAKRAAAQGAGD
ncbi:MAG: Gfo/Idh/MocA family protein [Planctomycetota bacterium]